MDLRKEKASPNQGSPNASFQLELELAALWLDTPGKLDTPGLQLFTKGKGPGTPLVFAMLQCALEAW